MNTGADSNNFGRFYGVGVGPGDPELLTIKAQRLLRTVDAICFTQLDDGRESYALGVVRGLWEEMKPELISITVPSDDTPVSQETWDNAAVSIGSRLREGRDVAFITEGDPMLYSEFSYLLDSVRTVVPEAAIEVMPGVSSILAAASIAQVPWFPKGSGWLSCPRCMASTTCERPSPTTTPSCWLR